MAKQRLTEAQLILKNIESTQVLALHELFKKKDIVEPIMALMDMIKNMDMKKILDSSGSGRSLDSLIDSANEQSFRRGRISFAVLMRALLINAEKEMEKREAKKK